MRRALCVLAAIAALATSCKGGKEGEQSQPGGGRGRGRGGQGGLAFAVDVLKVEAKKVAYTVTGPGTIEAFERVQVTARVAGVVDRVAFADGQEVKKGDTLVVIDSERYRLAVNGAKAAYDKAVAAVRDNEAAVARREEAMRQNPGLIPGEELETYRSKTVSAKADREVASQALQTAQLNLRDSSVRAPMEGVIQTRTIETGQYVQPGFVMATLLRSEPLLLRFQVEPLEAPRVKPGAIASFTMRETLRTFNAKITLVAAAADPATHMVAVTAEVDVGDGHKYWLRPGSFCDVSLEVEAQRDAVMIPRIAVRATDHGYVAYAIDNDAARERVLTLGMSTKEGWVEVRSGLAAGELLVVRGAEALTEGAKVRANTVTAESIKKGIVDDPPAASGAGSAGAPGPAGSDRPRRRREGAPSGSAAGALP